MGYGHRGSPQPFALKPDLMILCSRNERSPVISLFASSVAGRAALCFPAGMAGRLFALMGHMRITSIRRKRAEG